MNQIYTRAQQLPALLAQRIAILDGAMGTMIQRFKLSEAQTEARATAAPTRSTRVSKTFTKTSKVTTSCSA